MFGDIMLSSAGNSKGHTIAIGKNALLVTSCSEPSMQIRPDSRLPNGCFLLEDPAKFCCEEVEQPSESPLRFATATLCGGFVSTWC